mgnify:CR=1 FL=1
MSDNIQQLEHDHHIQLYKRYDLTISHGEGCYVYDTEGNPYLDMMAGIAVNALGYGHPRQVQAIKDQAEKLIHISNLVYNGPQSCLAHTITRLSGMDRVLFCNSGSEAIEGAIKLARKYAKVHGRSGNIISMENAFHGRTMGAISLGREKYNKDFKPLPAGFDRVYMNDIEALKAKVDDQTIAIVIEPVQGEGGIYPADEQYMKEVRALCDETGTLLILDEIQCGVGRTGTMYAYQGYNIEPDIVASAKGLGAGFPIGALLAKQEVADAFQPGDHGTTYGGNPLACAASLAALTEIEEEQLDKQAAEKGNYFMEKLRSAVSDIEGVQEVRGRGLMIGLALDYEGADVIKKLLKKGILANCAAKTVIRIVPPLIISYEQMDEFTEKLAETLKEVEVPTDG